MKSSVQPRRPVLPFGCSQNFTRCPFLDGAPFASPSLASPVGQLCDICLAWLGDNVFSIRVAATDNLKRLTDHFGTPWARDHILPKVGRSLFRDRAVLVNGDGQDG